MVVVGSVSFGRPPQVVVAVVDSVLLVRPPVSYSVGVAVGLWPSTVAANDSRATNTLKESNHFMQCLLFIQGFIRFCGHGVPDGI